MAGECPVPHNERPTMQTTRPPRSHHRHLLQIAGALAIVAFHCQAPGCQTGWAAVELFFVMAGIHMAPAMHRGEPALRYLASRYRRLLPESLAIWVMVLAFLTTGSGTRGMNCFAATAPLQLQNLAVPVIGDASPSNAIFGAMWFTGALLQLQLIACLCRRFWATARTRTVVFTAFVAGLSLRALFTWACTHEPRFLSGHMAEILYCLPVTHLEALTLGLLVGQGALSGLGRQAPFWVTLTFVIGITNHFATPGHRPWTTLGLEFPPRANFSHLWAYPLLAITAASLCSPTTPFAARLDRTSSSGWARAAALLAPLTFGVYCFHGPILASGIDPLPVLGRGTLGRCVLFAITMTLAFALSAVFRSLCERLGTIGRDRVMPPDTHPG
jgi:Acyltransferase family